MSYFTVRVELHGAVYSDYEKLHQEMQSRGLARTILASDGKKYQLPTAEYNFEGTATRDQILNLAKAAAEKTGKAAGILVSESVSRTWIGLPTTH